MPEASEKNVISLAELGSLISGLDKISAGNLLSHWDYPLSEIPHLMDGNHSGCYFLVRFLDDRNKFVYRLCEV